jgi:hypothetical protein
MRAGWRAEVRVEPGTRPHSGHGRALNEVTELPHRAGGAPAAGPCEKRGWPGTLLKCLESPIRHVLIEWRASPDKTCFVGNDNYIIGTRTPTLNVNDEYGITTPSGGLDFSGVPPGDYYICAKIDPYDVVAETAENDNSIVSSETIEVKPDGSGCPP